MENTLTRKEIAICFNTYKTDVLYMVGTNCFLPKFKISAYVESYHSKIDVIELDRKEYLKDIEALNETPVVEDINATTPIETISKNKNKK